MTRIKNRPCLAAKGGVDGLFTPTDFLIEQMGEALFNLSDSLRESGFLNNVGHHARYEDVLVAWRGLTEQIASADTHPKDGDALAAPLVSGAVPEGQTPNPSHRSTGE